MTLALRALSVAVPGRTLLDRLDLEIRPGECWTVLGRNGSGKTSLLLTAAGLRAPAWGQIVVDGADIASLARREAARRVGILLQEEPEFFWGSAGDYVALGAHAQEARAAGKIADAVRAALAELDLAERATQSYRSLSGGERQRARLAQLLVQAPRYLLLDEPLTHLDLRHQLATMQLLARLAAAGRCVLMALHEPWAAMRYCDHALLLYDSSRISAGPATRLLARETLERLYGCPLDAFADGRVLAATSSTTTT